MKGSDAVDNGRGAADVDTDFMAVDATGDAVRPPTPGTAPPSAGGARVAAQDLLPRPVGAYLRQVKVAHLASSPGLSAVGDLLGLSEADRVRVMTYMHFATRVPGGFQERQLVRATPQYRGGAWYDSIAFRCRDDGDDTSERFGQVRALLRLQDADFAIVAEMVRTVELGGADRDVRDQRYMLNAFLPSGGVRLHERDVAGGAS
ncbi:hypothetical protein I4F81_001849 [Pyropia yezoensis]|uniref:Uncharacterized protein n=1 Tax=Pyropia yezoensis TaxID=2788 RepID=A0ACC3BN66_PYRYE|nr:hypothetical protein I4F81_001849 [Neopyropia yezoensis]